MSFRWLQCCHRCCSYHRLGLGRLLTREAFNIALALDIQKIVARMTLDQTGARTVFEELGFRPEAVLRDEVKDRAGNIQFRCAKPAGR